MRQAAKIDSNQPEIVDSFKAHGASVKYTPVGDGFPDLVVGYNKRNYLIEVKSEKGKLRKEQIKFFGDWNGQADVIRTQEDVDKFMKRIRESGL